MDIIIELIPVIKVLLVFLITVILQQKYMPIGPAFLSGTLILQFWFPVSWSDFASTVYNSVFSGQTLSLSLIIIGIVSLSHSLKITGHFDLMVRSIQARIAGGRKTVFILPALVGLLPMPGGAIFSAPMVDEVSKNTSMSLRRKAASNHWFRHVWEYTWPLYPGVLLTAAIADISLLKLVTVNIPLTLAAIAAGFLFIARKDFFDNSQKQEQEKPAWKELFLALFPITAVVFCFIATRIFYSLYEKMIAGSIAPYTAFLPGSSLLNVEILPSGEYILLLFSITAGLAYLLFEYRELTPLKALKNRRLPSLVIMIVSLLLFQDVLKSSGAVQEITKAFIHLNLPLFLLSALLPFIVGLVTGITVGFVAGAFPILVPLIAASDPSNTAAYIVLGYGFGFMGVMLSPMHVCLVLTVRHFTAPMGQTLRILLLPAAAVMLTAAGVAGIVFLLF